MADVLTPKQRSRCMSAIRAKDTAPELLLRRLLRSAGYRYRVNDDSLPGKPDIVFPRRKKTIFVHGCFWHRHNCHSGRSVPSTRKTFWHNKLEENKKRGNRQVCELRRLGWDVLVVWQCQLKGPKAHRALARVVGFLEKKT